MPPPAPAPKKFRSSRPIRSALRSSKRNRRRFRRIRRPERAGERMPPNRANAPRADAPDDRSALRHEKRARSPDRSSGDPPDFPLGSISPFPSTSSRIRFVFALHRTGTQTARRLSARPPPRDSADGLGHPPAPRMHGSGKRCRFSVLNILRLSETTQTSRRFPRNSASSLIDPATGRDVPNGPAEHRSVPFLRLPAAGRKLRVWTPVPNGLRRTFFPRREREI